MPECKPSTAPSFADAFGATDFAKVDAHVIRPEEYEEIPELTDEMMARADIYVGNVLVRRGRSDADEANAFRLSPAIVAHFRESGPGWQVRITEILRDAIEREKIAG